MRNEFCLRIGNKSLVLPYVPVKLIYKIGHTYIHNNVLLLNGNITSNEIHVNNIFG